MIKFPESSELEQLPRHVLENLRFLCVSNVSMCDHLRTALLEKGAAFLITGKRTSKCKIGGIKFHFETSHKRATLGIFTGIIVNTHIEHEDGEGEIRFLMDDRYIDCNGNILGSW